VTTVLKLWHKVASAKIGFGFGESGVVKNSCFGLGMMCPSVKVVELLLLPVCDRHIKILSQRGVCEGRH
jgi:hypothetical protein